MSTTSYVSSVALRVLQVAFIDRPFTTFCDAIWGQNGTIISCGTLLEIHIHEFQHTTHSEYCSFRIKSRLALASHKLIFAIVVGALQIDRYLTSGLGTVRQFEFVTFSLISSTIVWTRITFEQPFIDWRSFVFEF